MDCPGASDRRSVGSSVPGGTPVIWATWIAVELLIALGCLAILTATDEEE
jgi:hypothetical protein